MLLIIIKSIIMKFIRALLIITQHSSTTHQSHLSIPLIILQVTYYLFLKNHKYLLSFPETTGMIRYFYIYSFVDRVWSIDMIEVTRSKELSACSIHQLLRNEDSCHKNYFNRNSGLFDSRELSKE